MTLYCITVARNPTSGAYALADTSSTTGMAGQCSAVDGPPVPVAGGVVQTTLLTLPAGALVVGGPSQPAVPSGNLLGQVGAVAQLAQQPAQLAAGAGPCSVAWVQM